MVKVLCLACLFLGMPLSAFPQGDTARASQAATLLSRYIQLASVTGSEKGAGVFFSGLCKSRGLHVKVFSDRSDSYNFSASLYPLESRKPNIVLLNHIDVVPVAGNWQHAPFSGRVADGMVWGRGAVDNKGMAIMQLLAVADLVELASTRDLPYNVTILSVSSEEAGGALGAKSIAENHLDALNAVLVLGEGGAGVSGILASDPQKRVFGIEISQKSSLKLRLSTKVASSGHGAVPPEAYANKKMVAALGRLLDRDADIRVSAPAALMFEALGKHERGLRGFAMRHPWLMKLFGGRTLREEPILHALVTNTATVTNISNPPTSPNQIPQRVTATLDCRLLPGTTQRSFIRGLRRTLRDKNIAVEVLSGSRPAPYTAPDTLFFEALCQAVTQVYPNALVAPILFPASNDNSYFRARGIPAYGLLPLYLKEELLRAIHNKDERVPVASLDSGVAVYRQFLVSILVGKQQPPRHTL
ncbi:M20/M25/M40 family metallo-hydrolase [Pontibacter pamirensis]|uniref:M20/M25/M40 family metallo-hydrolase n=1 Tax=Pontibacter pamirensis TaxID=2562824 RepID=UPI00138A0316|nr:M20/M25/M40 family metallo-hydrolase [Pontibacter pamirensis]